MRLKYYQALENIWYWLERKAGNMWRRYNKDRATYWLDWLPAYCARKRYSYQNARVRITHPGMLRPYKD